ncbi:hypothetical protein H6F90_11640 [Trichocoleus sp. FACHB-591]|uniref:hypothetical protein n=1 Tax=Trichocoleus TaxID=450526 RepID=UPI00168677A4|nr:hypothetical protein [Trichocoleus sp. FACHB-591]MBD2095802.1 hypothetical protein [Trichocoleus sp. FACHB-591]
MTRLNRVDEDGERSAGISATPASGQTEVTGLLSAAAGLRRKVGAKCHASESDSQRSEGPRLGCLPYDE